MKKIIVAPFASRLHGETYYLGVYEELRKLFVITGVRMEFLPVVSSEEEAEKLALEHSNAIPVFVALTGGVNSLMQKFAHIANYNKVILFGHGEHNSLASAISARAKLEVNGVAAYVFHCVNMVSEDCFNVIKRLTNVASVIAKLVGSRALLIGPYSEKPETAENYEVAFEASVDVMSIDNFAEKARTARGDYVDHFLQVFSRYESRSSLNKLIEVARLYATLRELGEKGGYDGIAIDCFPYIIKHHLTPCLALALLNTENDVVACEGDLISLALMMISKTLTGRSGWIANATAFSGNRAYFTHCTISLDMIENPIIMHHFESGYPYSLTGKLREKTYTIVSISPDYSTLAATIGHLANSGLIFNNMCRTQAILEMGMPTEIIPNIAVSNHHVLIPGDIREELRALTTLLTMDYIEYNQTT